MKGDSMERLTEYDEYGNTDIIGVDSANFQLNLEFKEFNLVTDALNKLSAYEDTGLTPEEIKGLVNANENLVKQNDKQYLQLKKYRTDRDYWKAEALKHCAKLGEIKLLVGRAE